MPAMVFVCVFSTAGFEFRFPVQDGTYKLENMEQKQSERIDGKVFFDGIIACIKFVQWYSDAPGEQMPGAFRISAKHSLFTKL